MVVIVHERAIRSPGIQRSVRVELVRIHHLRRPVARALVDGIHIQRLIALNLATLQGQPQALVRIKLPAAAGVQHLGGEGGTAITAHALQNHIPVQCHPAPHFGIAEDFQHAALSGFFGGQIQQRPHLQIHAHLHVAERPEAAAEISVMLSKQLALPKPRAGQCVQGQPTLHGSLHVDLAFQFALQQLPIKAMGDVEVGIDIDAVERLVIAIPIVAAAEQ